MRERAIFGIYCRSTTTFGARARCLQRGPSGSSATARTSFRRNYFLCAPRETRLREQQGQHSEETCGARGNLARHFPASHGPSSIETIAAAADFVAGSAADSARVVDRRELPGLLAKGVCPGGWPKPVPVCIPGWPTPMVSFDGSQMNSKSR